MLSAMRRWLVLLMIVLLPLRAAAGDFMSLGMALGDGGPVPTGMAPDCPMHLAAADAAPEVDDVDAAATSAAECGSCALCFPVAQVAVIAAVGADRSSDARQALGDDRYLSAVALGLLRPPES